MRNRWIGIVLFILSVCAEADTLEFSSGRTLEVLIENETSEAVTFRQGIGLITIPKNQIRKIEYDAPEKRKALEDQWKREHFANEAYAPEELKPLLSQYRQLQDQRREMVLSQSKLNALETESVQAEAKMDPLTTKILALRAEVRSKQQKAYRLHQLRTEKVREMNRLTTEMKRTQGKSWSALREQHAALERDEKVLFAATRRIIEDYQNSEEKQDQYATELKEARTLLQDLREGRPALQAKVGPYMKQISAFRALLKEYDSVRQCEEYGYVFKEIDKALQEMRFELQTETVPVSRRHNTLAVDVIINGKVPAKMIFDTGASTTTISAQLAEHLGIHVDEAEEQKVMLADGTIVSAALTVLDSVKVGTAVRQNVEASILEQPPAPGVDGLLGMSFLKYFTVQFSSGQDSVELIHFEADDDAL